MLFKKTFSLILILFVVEICIAGQKVSVVSDFSKMSYAELSFKGKSKIKATVKVAKRPLEVLPAEYGGRGYAALKLPEFEGRYVVKLESVLVEKYWNLTSRKILLPRLIFLDKDFKVIRMTEASEIEDYDVQIPWRFQYKFKVEDERMKYVVITSDDYRMREKCDFRSLSGEGQVFFHRIIVAWYGCVKFRLEKEAKGGK